VQQSARIRSHRTFTDHLPMRAKDTLLQIHLRRTLTRLSFVYSIAVRDVFSTRRTVYTVTAAFSLYRATTNQSLSENKKTST